MSALYLNADRQRVSCRFDFDVGAGAAVGAGFGGGGAGAFGAAAWLATAFGRGAGDGSTEALERAAAAGAALAGAGVGEVSTALGGDDESAAGGDGSTEGEAATTDPLVRVATKTAAEAATATSNPIATIAPIGGLLETGSCFDPDAVFCHPLPVCATPGSLGVATGIARVLDAGDTMSDPLDGGAGG